MQLEGDDNDEPQVLVIRGNNNPRETSPPLRDEEYIATNGLVHAVDQVLVPTLSLGHQLVFTGGFSILLSALDQTNLLTTLMNNRLQRLTLLAPTDAAFGALGTRALTYLTDRVEVLEFVLLYHVLDRIATRNDLLPTDGSNSTVVRNTLNSQFLRIVVTNETTTDSNNNETTTDVTVVVQGNPFRTSVVEPAQIIDPFDVPAVNGILHTIHQVLLPLLPVGVTAFLTPTLSSSWMIQALDQTGLLDTMNNLETGAVTLLVPTNEAFQALNVNSLDDLLNEQQDGDFLLTRVLETHVYRDGALFRESITSFVAGNQGTPIQLTSDSGTDWILSVTQFPQSVQDTAEVAVETVRTEPGLSVTRANFVDTQVVAFRGVIHWIDAVLLP